MTGRPTARSLDRYLLRGERIVAEIRRHKIVLLKPVSVVLLAIALAVWIDLNVARDGSPVVRFVWFVVLAALLWSAWRFLEWWYERFVVTDKRILLFHGFITRKVPMMPLSKVTDMTYERSIMGRLLGYGTFVLESAGQDQSLSKIDHVPDPDASYRAIVAEIFGIDDESFEGEGWDELDDQETEQDAPVEELEPAGAAHAGAPSDGTSPRTSPIYRSPDRDHRALDDTGELPPYDPDWRP